MFKFIKDFIGKLTMPEGMVEIHGEYWLECYPALPSLFIFRKHRYFKYRWRKVVQNKYGKWELTESYLSTNTYYEEV